MSGNAAPAHDEEDSTCFFCGKLIANGDWFARIRQNSHRAIFCRPRCVELFLEQSKRITPDWFVRPVTEY